MIRTAAVATSLLLLGACANPAQEGVVESPDKSGAEQVYHGSGFSVYVVGQEWVWMDTISQYSAKCVLTLTVDYEGVQPRWNTEFRNSAGERVFEAPRAYEYPVYPDRDSETFIITHQVKPEQSEFSCRVREYKELTR